MNSPKSRVWREHLEPCTLDDLVFGVSRRFSTTTMRTRFGEYGRVFLIGTVMHLKALGDNEFEVEHEGACTKQEGGEGGGVRHNTLYLAGDAAVRRVVD